VALTRYSGPLPVSMATWKLVIGTTSELMYISIDVITDVVNKVLYIFINIKYYDSK
jgi:hypothetical protein